MKKLQKDKVLIINNILCIVMMLALVAAMMLPCWDFCSEYVSKNHTCKKCGYVVEDVPGTLDKSFTCPDCGAKARDFKGKEFRVPTAENASVLEYTWLTFDCQPLTDHFNNYQLTINHVVMGPFLTTLLIILGLIFCAVNIRGCWQALFPLAGGIIMLCTFLGVPAFQLSPYWIWMVIASGALTLVSALLFAQLVGRIVKWCTVPVMR